MAITTNPHLALCAFMSCTRVTVLLPYYKLSYIWVGLQAGDVEIILHDDDFEVAAELRF
jgi:hypothetical protein